MHDNIGNQMLWIGGAMMAAAVFGAVAKRAKQPKVLGALIAGLAIGIIFTNTELLHSIRAGKGTELISGLAEIGAMLLLFKAGMEGNLLSILRDAKFGWKVAVIGVIMPMGGGFLYTYYAMDTHWAIALFQGGVFAATSVGITAAVLTELGVLNKDFARVIISAAVIDDVLGLIVLTVCQGFATGGETDALQLATQIGGAILFVIAIPLIGHYLAGRVLRTFNKVDPEASEAIILGWMFIYGAGAIFSGLAAIVGAYFAGVALEEVYFTRDGKRHQSKEVEHFIDRVIIGFAPVFFVYAGCVVNPEVFLNPVVLKHGLFFTLIAMAGKLFAGLVVPRGQRMIVGVGMAPRGEVGIIFATIGLSTGILSQELFGASMIMVLLTTLVTPPLLGAMISKRQPTEIIPLRSMGVSMRIVPERGHDPHDVEADADA